MEKNVNKTVNKPVGKTEKQEIVLNCIVAALAIALALFATVYEYYEIGWYAETLSNEERAGYAVAMIIVFIFGYIPAGVALAAFGQLTFRLTWKMYKADRKTKGRAFIGTTPRDIEEKNRALIALIVFKFISLAVIALILICAFGAAYTTLLSKIVYCVAAAVYSGTAIRSIVVRKKILTESEKTLLIEK